MKRIASTCVVLAAIVLSFAFPAFSQNQPPVNTSLTPNTGILLVDKKYTFTTVYSDPDGANNIAVCYVLINTVEATTNCFTGYYNAWSNLMSISTDLGGGSTGYVPGSANTLENSYCKLHLAECSVAKSGSSLTITWSVTFKPTFSGKSVFGYMRVADKNGALTPPDITEPSPRQDWEQKATFVTDAQPTNSTLTPSSGYLDNSKKIAMSSTHQDPDGYQDLANCYLLLNKTFTGANAAYLRYDAVANKLYVANNAGTAWLGGFTPGSANVIENSYCMLCWASGLRMPGSGLL